MYMKERMVQFVSCRKSKQIARKNTVTTNNMNRTDANRKSRGQDASDGAFLLRLLLDVAFCVAQTSGVGRNY